MSNKIKLKMKRVKLEYDFKKAELEEARDLREDNIEKFEKDFRAEMDYINRNESETKTPDETEEEKTSKNTIRDLSEEGLKALKNIYRQIASITHPDKIGDDSLVDEFHKAAEYYKSNNLPEIVYLAIKIGINLPVGLLQDELLYAELEKEIEDLSEKVSQIKKSISWAWAKAETEVEKETLRKILYNFWGISAEEVSNYKDNLTEEATNNE